MSSVGSSTPIAITLSAGWNTIRSLNATPHMWGTAADIYRIGSTILKTQESIDRYNDVIREEVEASICDSVFNEQELVEIGYKNTTVIPLLLEMCLRPAEEQQLLQGRAAHVHLRGREAVSLVIAEP